MFFVVKLVYYGCTSEISIIWLTWDILCNKILYTHDQKYAIAHWHLVYALNSDLGILFKEVLRMWKLYRIEAKFNRH